MILIADSGSTKTSWVWLSEGNIIQTTQSPGINPFYQEEEDIYHSIKEHMKDLHSAPVTEIHFYGAGCSFPEKKEIVRSALQQAFQADIIEMESDLIGAARALCQNREGIACILGTGSNSCLYNGKEIVKNVSPLGFMLGDEGSGAVMGKQLVADYLKNQLSDALKKKFEAKYQYTPAEIMDRVYKQPFPNRFLASFTPFLSENLGEPECRRIVEQGFTLFFERNVKQYKGCNDLPVHFVGSVAYHFRDILEEVASKLGYQLGTMLQEPMEGLVTYHGN